MFVCLFCQSEVFFLIIGDLLLGKRRQNLAPCTLVVALGEVKDYAPHSELRPGGRDCSL